MSLLPIFLKLKSRPCLVVGAGEIAAGKITSLVASEAQVTVVAPWAKPEIEELSANGYLTWHRREFVEADIDGQFLVVAGTNLAEINQHVYRLCADHKIICNAVDDPPHCDFYYSSVISRGDLQIAISTNGESPALAQRLRREIDAQLPNDLGPWLHDLGELRREVLAAYPAGEPRKALLHTLAQRDVCGSHTCPTRAIAFPQNKPSIAPTEPGKVWLVGAGPGDPDLLTVKAARLLSSADLVLHDDLVPQPILALLPPTAEILSVGKRCGRASITQHEIHTLMIAGARANRSVIRLKSGDPLLFGRAGEEMDALREAGIPFEIVSGVSAAFAAASAAQSSLTDRRASSSVLLSTAHHAPDESVNEQPTRIVYMPGRDLSAIARTWRAAGLSSDYPCVLVSRAGQVDQQVTRTTLAILHAVEPGPAPTLLLGGEVFAQRRAQNEVSEAIHSISEEFAFLMQPAKNASENRP